MQAKKRSLLPPGTQFDLFRGNFHFIREKPSFSQQCLCHLIMKQDVDDMYPTTLGHTIKFGKKVHPECARFSPDGQFLLSCSVDGFIELLEGLQSSFVNLKRKLRVKVGDDFPCLNCRNCQMCFPGA